MKIKFSFSVPPEYLNTKSTTTKVNVTAEVININTKHEVCFIQNVSGTGITVLWDLIPSEELFQLVSQKACSIAKSILANENVVTIAQEHYKNESIN